MRLFSKYIPVVAIDSVRA